MRGGAFPQVEIAKVEIAVVFCSMAPTCTTSDGELPEARGEAATTIAGRVETASTP